MIRPSASRSTLRSIRHSHSIPRPHLQQFSSSPAIAALNPHRRTTDKSPNQSAPAPARRDQSTATATATYAVHLSSLQYTGIPANLNVAISGNRDHYPAQHSTRTRDGMMYSHYRTRDFRRWMSRTHTLILYSGRGRSWLANSCARHRFIGLSGGEIFHEMMLRQGVKHVCTFAQNKLAALKDLKLTDVHSRLSWRRHFACF